MNMDKQQAIKYLMFENDTNVCWLDASIALIAHNRTFRKIVQSSPESQINKIISTYNKAIGTFNSSVHEQKLKSPDILKAIQVSTLKYLKQFLKFKTGEPDSAFCALLNLIYQDKSNIKESLNVNWIWRKRCSNCAMNSVSAISKPIITLSKVNTFHPARPSCIYTCICKSKQEMTLIYKELPPCLIFHFEKGVGTSTNFPLFFSIKGREYQLTGIVILEKSSTDLNVNHFVTWIRNPRYNNWLECNDLNPGFASFTPVKPEFHLEDVYISVFEAFDDLGRINNEVATDNEQVENPNVELIDLSDEEDATNTGSHSKTGTLDSSKSINDEIFNFSKNSFSEKGASKELFAAFKKDTALEDLKMYGDGKSKESETSSHIKNKKVYLSSRKLPIKISHDEPESETIFKNFDYQDKFVDEFTDTNKSRNEATNNPEYEVSESSVADKKETFSSPSVSNETSKTENLEMHITENPKESKEDYKSNQKTSVTNFNLSKELSPNKHKTEVKSGKKSFETKKAKVTEPLNGNKKDSCSIPANKNISAIKNSQLCDNEKINKSKKKHSSQSISIDTSRFSNKSYPNKHELEAESEKLNYDGKQVNEIAKIKKFFVEATKYPNPSITDAPDGNTKDKILNLLDSDTGMENLTEDDTTHEEPSLTMCRFIENASNVSSENENKRISSNEEKRERTEDEYASSSKRKKERSRDKYVNPSKEKRVAIINDQTASTSVADDELTKNALCRSKRSPKSDSNCVRKKTKLSNINKIHNSNSSPNKISTEKLKSIVDSVVNRTVAAFFEKVIQIHDAKQQVPDSAP